MKLSHYKEAEKILKEADKIVTISSQVLFRKSQALSYNKGCSLEEIEEAKELVLFALKTVQSEAVFKEEFKGLQKRLALENVDGEYRKQLEFVKEREKEIKESRKACASCKYICFYLIF